MPSRVVVLMPAFNAGTVINRAARSLRQGTYECDLLIVDDGSTVPVSEVLEDFPRTRILRLEKNGGVARAKNAGLRAILEEGYEFVASLDADDINHPDRIARQVAFLDQHPEVAVVGTWGRGFDEKTGKTLFYGRPPAEPDEVRKAMRYNSAVNHTSTMVRTSAYREVGVYSLRYPAAEDYDLFRRIGEKFQLANIPEVLIDISISPGGVSLKRRRRQLFDRLAIQLKFFEPLQPGAWLGVAKTLALFFVPVPVVRWLKSFHKDYAEAAEPVDDEDDLLVGSQEQLPGSPSHL